MATPEIFTKGQPKSVGFTTGFGGDPDVTWEDILLAFQGVRGKQEGFFRYVYMEDPGGQHDFYAGLFMEAMARPDVQKLSAWCVKNHRSASIDKMVRMVMREWQSNKRSFFGWPVCTENARANTFGVSRGVWTRWYSKVYSQIAAIPAYWQGDVMAVVNQRLKK